MEINFINKRIWEQKSYIWKIEDSDLPPERKEEIIKSAQGQLDYFEKKFWLNTQSSHQEFCDSIRLKLEKQRLRM